MTTTIDYDAIARRHSALPNPATANLPATYEHACSALAKCERLDECKDWADKAAALASYARQADDPTLERLAVRIKARAVRRCGDLLHTFDARGAHRKKDTSGHSSQHKAGTDAGLSERQIKTAVRVANVPQDVFDAEVEKEQPTTVQALAEMGTQERTKIAPPGFQHGTYAIGRLKELAVFCGEHSPASIAEALYPHERSSTAANARIVYAWLGNLLNSFPRSEVQR